MARTSAISILQAVGTSAQLQELYGYVIENVQKETLSSGLKSQAYTGDPAAGSVEFKRFANSASKSYGTARTAGKGDAITAPPVTINLNQHKEIVEECAKFDLDTFGVGDIMARRVENHIDSLVYELDTAFFTAAANAATSFTTSETDLKKILEGFIQTLETVKNNYVRGVPRNLMDLVCAPAFYGKIRDLLDSQSLPNVDTAAEAFNTYHGVRVYSSVNLPAGIDAILQVRGAMAQPVVTYQYGEPEKIPLSNDYAVSLFYDYGVGALAPDLIFKMESPLPVLGELDVTSVAGTVKVGDTVISINPSTPTTGNKFVYKLGTAYAPFKYDDILSTGWTALDSGDTIAAGDNTKITVAEVTTAANRARGRGIAVVVKKTS